jgi:hypothetical protein
VYVLGLAPLFKYKSASLPISTESRTIPAFFTAGEENALTIDPASRKAAVMLFWPKFTPHVTWVSVLIFSNIKGCIEARHTGREELSRCIVRIANGYITGFWVRNGGSDCREDILGELEVIVLE